MITGIHRHSRKREGWQLRGERQGREQRRGLPSASIGDGVIAQMGFVDLAKRLKLQVVNGSGIAMPKGELPAVVFRSSGSDKS